MLSEIGSQFAYSPFLRLITILEKKVFQIFAVSKPLSTMLSCSMKVNFSFDTILSDRNSY